MEEYKLDYKHRVRAVAFMSAVIMAIVTLLFLKEDTDAAWGWGFTLCDLYWGFHAWFFIALERREAKNVN